MSAGGPANCREGQAAAVGATGRKAMLCLAWVFHASLWCRYCDAVDLNCGCPQK